MSKFEQLKQQQDQAETKAHWQLYKQAMAEYIQLMVSPYVDHLSQKLYDHEENLPCPEDAITRYRALSPSQVEKLSAYALRDGKTGSSMLTLDRDLLEFLYAEHVQYYAPLAVNNADQYLKGECKPADYRKAVKELAAELADELPVFKDSMKPECARECFEYALLSLPAAMKTHMTAYHGSHIRPEQLIQQRDLAL